MLTSYNRIMESQSVLFHNGEINVAVKYVLANNAMSVEDEGGCCI